MCGVGFIRVPSEGAGLVLVCSFFLFLIRMHRNDKHQTIMRNSFPDRRAEIETSSCTRWLAVLQMFYVRGRKKTTTGTSYMEKIIDVLAQIDG